MTTNKSKMPAAKLYDVQPGYKRFNQKYNMTRQPIWNEKVKETHKNQPARLKHLVEESQTGYSLLDWGQYTGSRANSTNAGFNINCPNMRGNSWQPLAKRSKTQAMPVPYMSFDRWRGDVKGASRLVRKMALRFGADMSGICHLDRRWVYSHWFDEDSQESYPIKFSDESGYEGYNEPNQIEDGTQVIPKEMKYVVVLLFEMNREAIAAAPTLTAMAEVSLSYSRISFATLALAEFIRGLGYHAIPSSNCTALSIPLAVDAGLGQLGRNAKLINPLFGPRCRISKIVTDLPLAVDKPVHFGVTEFCNKCMKCAKTCPVGAIPFGDRSVEPENECNNRGVLQWQLDHKKCLRYWAEVGTNCGICIRTCPFNKGRSRIHGVSRWAIKNFKFVDPLLIKLDDLMGYGEFQAPEEF